jgi:alkanesulfonate monooxygenase SsuD/methylene tetrahydromethanopterin reductase-like flavin-dependent oxidoreductase (luciferase family)
MLAFLAAKTSQLRLGTGVLPAAVHHPVLLLESVLQLDAVSGGRLDLGIGSGSEAGPILQVLETAPEDSAERANRLYELMADVRPGHPLGFPVGGADQGLVLDPAPTRPLLQSVWTAAGRNAVELTKRYNTGLLLPRPMPLTARKDLADAYRAGVVNPRVVHFKAGLVAPTASEARQRAAGFVQAYARRYLNQAVGGPESADFAAAIDALDFAVGTPDEVVDRMRAWLGPFHHDDAIAIQFAGPAVKHEHVLQSMELLAPHLAPFHTPHAPAGSPERQA